MFKRALWLPYREARRVVERECSILGKDHGGRTRGLSIERERAVNSGIYFGG